MAKKEQDRKLTPAEEKRMRRFEAVSAELEGQGYRKTPLTIGLVAANVMIMLIGIPFLVLSMVLFFHINGATGLSFGAGKTLGLVAAMIVLTVIHELIHGAVWSLFCENGWKDIDFGFITQYLTPYCTCAAPLPRWSYVEGALAPLVILGIVPYIAGLFSGSVFVFFLGIMMILGAGGDIMLTIKLLRFKAQGEEVLIYDHPTEAGSVVFDR